MKYFSILKGYGTFYYKEGGVEYYEGEWYAGKRSGWGRMYYANGDIYEGKLNSFNLTKLFELGF